MKRARIDDLGREVCWRCGYFEFDRQRGWLIAGVLLAHIWLRGFEKCLRCGTMNRRRTTWRQPRIRRPERARSRFDRFSRPVPVLAESAPLRFRIATPVDVEVVVALVNGAYRGDRSTRGWTTEAHLLDGIRTDADEVRGLIEAPDSVIVLAERAGEIIGTVLLQRDDDAAYLGMLVIEPEQQASGLGKQLMRAAEEFVQHEWHATRVWMTVLVQRSELIAFYERRGYRRTGRFEPWPSEAKSTPKVDGLRFEILEKHLH